MRDAMGGSVILVIIVAFIVIALGYMAFNVNYTKAFRMKNKIISEYEDFGGKCKVSSTCENNIKNYANEIGYTLGNMSCPSGFSTVNNLYCVRENEVLGSAGAKHYYTVITKINIDIPVINNILDMKYFEISGDTKSFCVNEKGC